MTSRDLGTPARSRIIPLVVASTFFMQMLDNSIINTSLPQMAMDFGIEAVDLSVGVTVYMLFAAAFLPLAGWLADRFGARRVYLAAIALFALSSVGCGLSHSLWQFVLARAVQGLGGAMMTPVGRIIVLRSTDKAGLLNALATIAWPALAAPILGPVIGGFVTTYLSWRWNFLANLPIGLLAMILVRRFVPDYRGERSKSFDLTGFALVSSSLLTLLHGLEAASHGVKALPLAAMVTGVLLGVAAIRHLKRARHPLLDLSAFAHPTFALTTLSGGMLARLAISSSPFLLPLLFQEGLGYRPVDAGFFLLAYFGGNLAMKSLVVKTLRRFGFRTVVLVNGLLVAASIMTFATFTKGAPVPLMMAILAAAGLARSMQFTSLGSLVYADIGDAQRSSASTLSSMSLQVSMALGVSSAAAFLNLSRTLRGSPTLALADYRVAFLCLGALALLSCWVFLRLPPNAGAEVTGRGLTDP